MNHRLKLGRRRSITCFSRWFSRLDDGSVAWPGRRYDRLQEFAKVCHWVDPTNGNGGGAWEEAYEWTTLLTGRFGSLGFERMPLKLLPKEVK